MPNKPGTLLVELSLEDKEYQAVDDEVSISCFPLLLRIKKKSATWIMFKNVFFSIHQMQATIREHRDNGHAGGIFARYNVLKVGLVYKSMNVAKVLYIYCQILYFCSQIPVFLLLHSSPSMPKHDYE